MDTHRQQDQDIKKKEQVLRRALKGIMGHKITYLEASRMTDLNSRTLRRYTHCIRATGCTADTFVIPTKGRKPTLDHEQELQVLDKTFIREHRRDGMPNKAIAEHVAAIKIIDEATKDTNNIPIGLPKRLSKMPATWVSNGRCSPSYVRRLMSKYPDKVQAKQPKLLKNHRHLYSTSVCHNTMSHSKHTNFITFRLGESCGLLG